MAFLAYYHESFRYTQLACKICLKNGILPTFYYYNKINDPKSCLPKQ